MKVYNVGPSDLTGYDHKNIKDGEYDWFVYWYEDGYYDGEGEAVGYKDGNLYFYDLGHCSCYGPMDNSADKMSAAEWIISDNVLDPDAKYKEVRDKVLELLR